MKNILAALLVAIIAAFATVKMTAAPTSAPVTAQVKKETLFEKLQRTHTMRCGYISWSKSYFSKDPNTGKFEGIGYEMAEAVAQTLGIKLEWVEEVGVGTMYEGLNTGRYDAVCTPIWLDAIVAANSTMTIPAYSSPVHAYARGDDTRFIENDPDALAKINNKDIKLVDVDGSNGVIIYKNRYPNATLLSMPGTMSGAEIIQQVAQKKADITQQNPAYVEDFLKVNPGALKRVTAKPLNIYPTALFILPPNEWQTKEWIDQAVITMINIGTVERILDVFDPEKKTFIRPQTVTQ